MSNTKLHVDVMSEAGIQNKYGDELAGAVKAIADECAVTIKDNLDKGIVLKSFAILKDDEQILVSIDADKSKNVNTYLSYKAFFLTREEGYSF